MTNNNKFTVLYQNKNGIELNTFLLENKNLPEKDVKSLKNKRVFYVVKAKLDGDKNVFKIGISEKGYNSAVGRLIDYVHFYGVENSDNKCMGVKLYLLLANVFNPDVDARNAAVRRLETKVKAKFRDDRVRGTERIDVSIDELFKYLEENKFITDIEPVVRQTPRFAAKGQAAADSVIQILSHSKSRKGEMLYEVEFPTQVYHKDILQAKKGIDIRKLTYEEVILLPRGKRLLDAYLKKENLKTQSKLNVQTRSAAKQKASD